MPNTPINTENHSVAFQNRILVFIHDLGMNQKEFAEYLGVSQPVVSHIISGANPACNLTPFTSRSVL